MGSKRLVTSWIKIERTIDESGRDIVWVERADEVSLVETLGLLEFAKDTFIRTAMEEQEVVDNTYKTQDEEDTGADDDDSTGDTS